jgi:hypothetical protein
VRFLKGEIMVRVLVTYKYGAKGQRPSSMRPNESVTVEGKTESAVMAALRRAHPTYGEIIILKIA